MMIKHRLKKRKLKEKSKQWKGNTKKVKKRAAKARKRAVRQSLDAWEKEEIDKAVKKELELKRKNKPSLLSLPGLEKVQASLSYAALSCKLIRNDDGKLIDIKNLSVKHILDNSGVLRYWGAIPKSLRPKPNIIKNGDRSVEDLIFNPDNPKDSIKNSPREKANTRVLRRLMSELGFDEPRNIRVDEPGKLDSFILNTDIDIPVSIDSVVETKRKHYLLSDAINGARRFFTKKDALAAATQLSILTYDGPSKKYLVKRWQIRLVKKKNKTLKKIRLLEKFPLL